MYRDLPELHAAVERARKSKELLRIDFPSLHPVMRMALLDQHAVVSAGDERFEALLSGISPRGFRLSDVLQCLSPGQEIIITCGQAIAARGMVTWCRDGDAGVLLAN